MKIQLSLFVAVAMLAGCGQESPPPPTPAAPPVSAPSAPAPQPDVAASTPVAAAAAPVGDATLSVSPGSFRACDAVNGAVTATAKWDVRDKGIKEVSIYVEAPGNKRQLWLNGGDVGESTTGPWVFDQSRFMMVERGSEKPIAELVVKAEPCN